jgi:hypothetical protein
VAVNVDQRLPFFLVTVDASVTGNALLMTRIPALLLSRRSAKVALNVIGIISILVIDAYRWFLSRTELPADSIRSMVPAILPA